VHGLNNLMLGDSSIQAQQRVQHCMLEFCMLDMELEIGNTIIGFVCRTKTMH